MEHGFVKVAAVTPKIKVADPIYNAKVICEEMEKAEKGGAKIIVFPELCLTGYTCGDLFFQETLLREAKEQLAEIAEFSEDIDAIVFIGLPLEKNHKLYNVAAVLAEGEIQAFIPKRNLPNYAEFNEARYFVPGNRKAEYVEFEGEQIPFGTDILFEADGMEGLVIACEICEDIWAPNTPSTDHAFAGADVIVNLSASSESVGKDLFRESLVKSTSARLFAGYVYASAGEGESSQDMVFGGHNIIAENGAVLAQAKLFSNEITYADLDIQKIRRERRRITSFLREEQKEYLKIAFTITIEETKLDRTFPKTPFVPRQKQTKEKYCENIITMQSFALKKRYEHIGCKTAVLGISGGLDSTLALLVTVRAFDILNIPRKNIISITMPCFGTTDRTYDNACLLAKTLGTTLQEIDIREAVTVHLENIHHDINVHDVTYENAQARERTQVLMDIANQVNGLVIGTGDMSELALGFATYNGDHMSMYGVNAGVPKTLIRHLVQYCADICENEILRKVLLDVLDTPVSPELLPPSGGEMLQKTEDIVGPYELHDFFLYYMLRFGFEPVKIYRIANKAFEGDYTEEIILKWMKIFYKRFFSQQFKRSCLPDGPKIGSVAMSPRGDLHMPSDACADIWMKQLEELN